MNSGHEYRKSKSPNEFGLKPAIKKPKILRQYAKVHNGPGVQRPKSPIAQSPTTSKPNHPMCQKIQIGFEQKGDF